MSSRPHHRQGEIEVWHSREINLHEIVAPIKTWLVRALAERERWTNLIGLISNFFHPKKPESNLTKFLGLSWDFPHKNHIKAINFSGSVAQFGFSKSEATIIEPDETAPVRIFKIRTRQKNDRGAQSSDFPHPNQTKE